MNKELKIEGAKFVIMLLGFISGILMTSTIMHNSVKKEEPITPQVEEYTGYLVIDEEAETAFLNHKEVMANIFQFVEDGAYCIQVERIGFQNPMYYEKETFKEAVEFVEGLR